MGVGTREGLCFDRGFLGDRARLLQCLHQAYLEVLGDPLKNGGRPIVVRNNFQEGVGHYTDQRGKLNSGLEI